MIVLSRNTTLGSYSGSTWSAYAPFATGSNLATSFAYPGTTASVRAYSEQIRLTSAGFKIRYIGSELNKSGMFVWGKTKEKDAVLDPVPTVS